METKEAWVVRRNRRKGESDEDTVEEWEQMSGECDWEGDGWAKRVEEGKPNVETEVVVVEGEKTRREVDGLREDVKRLVELVEGLTRNKGDGKEENQGGGDDADGKVDG